MNEETKVEESQSEQTPPASHCYASVYDEIIRKRKEAGGNMAMGKHTAANATCCQRVIEDLQSAGLCNIADWAIWMMWWRMMDWQTAKQVDEMRLEEIASLRQRIDQLEREKRGIGPGDQYA